MRFIKIVTSFIGFIAISGTAHAEHHKAADSPQPKLVVAISVDQLSADLFSEYRSTFTGGLKRLADGAVFPSGYQGHAATETCPGHATIMTGVHPGRAGIIANNWIDLDVQREDKTVYCAEDERIAGTSFGNITAATQGDYVASAWHLLVPTLGERLKKMTPKSRNVAVAGKDRSALMMGGQTVDAIYWWKGSGFTTLKGRKSTTSVTGLNADIATMLANPRAPYAVPSHCSARNEAIQTGENSAVGTYHFQRPANGGRIFRASPDFDAVTLQLAQNLVTEMKLGQQAATDVLSVGLSATDYIGHAFGTNGAEMCIQMAALDRSLDSFFEGLDAMSIDYVVVLTADHGGHDLPERLQLQGAPEAARIDPELNWKGVNATLQETLGLQSEGQLIYADSPLGDYYVSKTLSPSQRASVKQAAMTIFADHPQVHKVLDGAELAQMPWPTGPVEEWTMAERTRASYHPDRSGDFIVLLKKAITPIAEPMQGYVATHGSPWDYDRRVPILFWHRDMKPFEQSLSVQTVDIAPTLAALVGVDIPADETDGRCLDLDAGAGSTCD